MEQPNYYAVLPAGVRYDKRLKPMEKLIYAELTCLCQKQGYCWATNAYFAELYDASKETVSRWFSHLQDCGYIKISIDPAYENGRRITLELSMNEAVKLKRILGEFTRMGEEAEECNAKQDY